MADAYQSLTSGVVPSAAAIIYAPSAAGSGAAAIIGSGHFINNDTVARTFQVWVNGSDDAHAKLGNAANPVSLGPGESLRMDAGEVWAIGPSDSIQAVASVSGKIAFELNGDRVS